MDRRDETLRRLQPHVTRARAFSGWSFTDVAMRPLEPGPHWDYEGIARQHARRARSILDLGTGGGEVLARITGGLTSQVVATEEWEVNAPVARRRLAPLGVAVVRCSSLQLPFDDESFDLILDRHEALDPDEVVRVLRPGGYVVTQQVEGDTWPELATFFPRKQGFGDHFTAYRTAFAAAGMAVAGVRHRHCVAYATLGDVVFMLLITPWTIPGFDPEQDIDALLALEDACGTSDGIVLTEGYYLLTAKKGADR